MTGLAVALGVLAVVAIVAAVLGRRQLAAEHLAVAAAKERLDERAGELVAVQAARSDADDARSEAEARATDAEQRASAADERAVADEARANTAEQQARAADALAADADLRAKAADERASTFEAGAASAQERAKAAEDATTSAEERARGAEQRAADAETAREAAQRNADAASTAAQLAEERAVTAEARATDAQDDVAEPTGHGLDPQLMWTLEQMRSERTWRQSVAVGNENASVFDGATDPLLEALQVELDALREEVGAVIDLDAELPDHVSAGASVLMLRLAQELLAGVVHRSEETTLRIHADDRDVLVTVQSVDEAGRPVEPGQLLDSASTVVEPIDGGVRIRNVITEG